MFRVVQKLKALNKPLHKFLQDQGNLHTRVNELHVELDAVQRALDLDPYNDVLRDEEAIYLQAFNSAKMDEERFLCPKAKIDWLKAGDSNSAYFHKVIKSRNQRSRIDVITNADNVEVSSNSVPDVFVSHYQSFLGADVACDVLDSEGLYNKKVSDVSNTNMVFHITDDEIKRAMFSIGEDKALGPDGYTSAFFKKGWNVIGQDICSAIRDFFDNGRFLKEINHTFVALIPKVTTPQKELMHNYHQDRGAPRCAFKVDIQNAYDTVDWYLLDGILKGFGFHPTMVKWRASSRRPSFALSFHFGYGNFDVNSPKTCGYVGILQIP
ncbi:hypothetical protein Tco_0787624 [Tanacetum coccineum]